MSRWSLRRAHNIRNFTQENSVSLFSYFYHLGDEKKYGDLFHSHQWETLPDFLKKNGLNSNWIHVFPFSRAIPDSKTGLELALKFNKNSNESGNHAFLEGYLSVATLLRALKYWILLVFITPRIINLSRHFRPAGSAVSLWPFLKNDWHSSLFGEVAMKNCLWLSLFDSALLTLPTQKLGLYICENQGWEYALIHSWKKHKHGKLIAVPHATVRYWDLMYFREMSPIGVDQKDAPLCADALAVNGKFAESVLIGAGIDTSRIVEVEALRYLYLQNIEEKVTLKSRNKAIIKLLILGDFSPEKTSDMLQVVIDALHDIDGHVDVTLKLHPACKPEELENLVPSIKIKDSSLQTQLQENDLAFCSSLTAATLDAAIVGLPVVVMLDGMDFNFSPLRNFAGVEFIRDGSDLKTALTAGDFFKPNITTENIFNLDDKLPKWQSLISKTLTIPT